MRHILLAFPILACSPVPGGTTSETNGTSSSTTTQATDDAAPTIGTSTTSTTSTSPSSTEASTSSDSSSTTTGGPVCSYGDACNPMQQDCPDDLACASHDQVNGVCVRPCGDDLGCRLECGVPTACGFDFSGSPFCFPIGDCSYAQDCSTEACLDGLECVFWSMEDPPVCVLPCEAGSCDAVTDLCGEAVVTTCGFDLLGQMYCFPA